MIDNSLPLFPTIDIPLRRWQRRALKRLSKLSKRDILVVATPGSGKTMLALTLARRMLDRKQVERVVVVTVTDHLRHQWKDVAHRLEIHLDPRWSNADGVEAPDYHGVCVSYQQISYAPSLYRMNCKRPTMVIFDEIHHAADDLKWGDSLREAFETADFRLALSGTPFRSDNNPIPFITYEEGKSRADFTYSYGQALADGICRPVFFPSFEGEIEWLSRDGHREEHSLLTPLGRDKAAERLRATLQPDGGWMRGVLSEADRQLSLIRSQGHTDAAGLVFAVDQEHARRIAEVLGRISGAEPIIAISDDPDASRKIKAFGRSHAKWIICVRMLSEGVDIPRLRVGVYATNVTTELTFRQAVGRFVRTVGGIEEEHALLYIPAIESLVRHAMEIKEERDHQLSMCAQGGNSQSAGEGASREASPHLFTPIASTSKIYETIVDGGRFDPAELANAEEVKREMGLRMAPELVAALLRKGAEQAGVFMVYGNEGNGGVSLTESGLVKTERQPSLPSGLAVYRAGADEVPMFDRKQALRNETSKLANKLAGLLGFKPWQIHKQWKELGGMAQSEATVENLREKREWLLKRIQQALRDRAP